MTITRELLKSLRADLDAALTPLAAKYGITLAAGNASFSGNHFTFKLEGSIAGAKSQEAELYEQSAKWHKWPPLGSEITIGRERFTITGMASRGTNNILISRVRDDKSFKCSPDHLPKQPAAPTMTLADFTKEVNDLEKKEVEIINGNPGKIFGAEHIALPESLLKIYHEQGLTPAQTLRALREEAEREGRAEAMAS